MSNILRPGLKQEEKEKNKTLAREAANLPEVQEANKVVEGAGDISDHKGVAIGVTDKAIERGNISTIQGKQIKENINNPEKMQRSIENTIGNKKASLTDSFMESLAFFMPQALGAGIGALFEGSAGALEGASIAGSLAKEKRDYDLQRERLEQTRSNRDKTDITPDFVTEDGEPVFTRETKEGAEFFDRDGNKVTEKVIPIQKYTQEEREKRLKSQFQTKLTEGQLDSAIKATKDFRTNNKESIDQLSKISNLHNLISKNLVTPDQVATFNAKAIFGESRITDEDVKRAGIPLDVFNRFKMDLTAWGTGTLSVEAKKKSQKILDTILKHKKKELEEKAGRQAGSKLLQGRTGLSKKELVEEFMRKAELTKGSVVNSKKPNIAHGTETIRNGKKYRYNSKIGKFQRVR